MKKVIIFIIIILLIALATYLGIKLNNDETKEAMTNNTVSNNIITNTMINNDVINEIENIIENNVEVDAHGDPEDVTIPDVIADVETNNDDEIALNIVKEDWGEDNTVYFRVEGTNENGEYKIGVYDAATTRNLARYTVNIETKTFTKR